jgi:poly(hydroxyalkanoate) polymerase-like protein
MAPRDEGTSGGADDLAASAAESAGGADAALGINPLVGVGSGVAEVLAGFREIGREAITHPWLGVEPSTEFIEQVGRSWVGRSQIEPKRGDRRFADPTWRDNPFYRAWMQSYLAWTGALERFVDSTGLDAKNAQRARFALSLVTDAFAPTNVWLGNPAALKKFVETGGVSAIHGFENMLDDIAHNRGMPAQVDKSAFELGKNLALTPGRRRLSESGPRVDPVRASDEAGLRTSVASRAAPDQQVLRPRPGPWSESHRIPGPTRHPDVRVELAQSDSGRARVGPRDVSSVDARSD